MARGLKGIKKPHPLGSVPTRSGVAPLSVVAAASSATASGFGGKISELPAADAANDSDQLEVNQSGTTRRVTVGQITQTLLQGAHLTPEQFGAVGDGTTDDAQAIRDMLAAGGSGATYIFRPGATYYIASTVTVAGTASNATIIGWGATISVANAVTVGLKIGDVGDDNIFTGNIFGLSVTKEGVANAGDIGIDFVNVTQGTFYHLETDHFAIGFNTHPPTGCRVAYASFYSPYVHRNLVNWKITLDVGGGFAAENKVFGGRFTGSSTANSQYHVLAQRAVGASSSTHWVWYSPSVEAAPSSGAISAFKLEGIRDWLIDEPRPEGTWSSGYDIQMDADSQNNRIELSYTANAPVTYDLGINNHVRYRNIATISETGDYTAQITSRRAGDSRIVGFPVDATLVAMWEREAGARVSLLAEGTARRNYSFGSMANNALASLSFDGTALVHRISTADLITLTNTAMNVSAAVHIGFGTANTDTLIGTNLTVHQNITGSLNSHAVVVDSSIRSDVTTSSAIFYSQPALQATAFTLGVLMHFYVNPPAISGGAAITTQYGFRVSANMTSAATNYGFHSAIADAAGRFNFYASGTAPNRFTGATVFGSYIEGTEITAPAAPATNSYRLYAEDNGAGKTRLMVKFATGAAVQIAIEP